MDSSYSEQPRWALERPPQPAKANMTLLKTIAKR